MQLSELQNTTSPVTIKRGTVQFTLDCALEKLILDENPAKIPTEGVTYAALFRESNEAEINHEAARYSMELEHQNFQSLSDLELMRKVIAAERTKPGAKKQVVVSDEDLKNEIEKRLSDAEERLTTIRAEIDASKMAKRNALARRLAFLVASSDITDAHGAPILSGAVEKTPEQFALDANVFAENFSDVLLQHCLKRVEAEVFSPLVTTGA